MNSMLQMLTDTSAGGNSFAPPVGGSMQVGMEPSLLALLWALLSAPQGRVVGNPANQLPPERGPVP